jgi:hypothetical protein
MSRNKPVPVLAGAPDMATLERFVQLLNMDEYWSASLIQGRKMVGGDYRPVQGELRKLVAAWQRSGPDVNKLLNANPMVSRYAQEFRTFFIPTHGPTARLAFLAAPDYSSQVSPVEVALGLFLHFLINPYNEKLRGPCKYCGNFYLKKTERKKSVYCSDKCGHRFTSLSANRAQRDREHKEQIQLAMHSIEKWSKIRTAMAWKEWVYKDTRISKNFLTRAVRGGELVQPVKQSRGQPLPLG